MKLLKLILLLLTLQVSTVQAQNLLMVRAAMPFEIAMEDIQSLLKDYGYQVAHTQHCDGGLSDFGYKTDFYRIIFFGKIDEVRQLSQSHPEIVPFLPLKLLVFAENDETVVVSLNPETLTKYFTDPKLLTQLRRWNNDIMSILNEIREFSFTKVTNEKKKP